MIIKETFSNLHFFILTYPSVWNKNGTYKNTTTEFSDGALVKLVKLYPNMLVVTEKSISFMRPNNLRSIK